MRLVGVSRGELAAVLGGGVVMGAGGVLMQIALRSNGSNVLGWISIAALILGVTVLTLGERSARNSGRTDDRRAALTVLVTGLVLLGVGALLALAPGLRGLGFVAVACAAVAIALADHSAFEQRHAGERL